MNQVLIERAVQLMLKSRFTIAFSGAGLSRESGIPTFRGDEGIWERFPPIIY